LADPEFIWRVNRKPRATVLEMGEYMAADDGPRETILRNLKYERIAPSLIYDKLYQAVAGYLASPTLDRRILDGFRRNAEAERDACETVQKRENLQYALNSLDAFERSLNALDTRTVLFERLPHTGRPILMEGVRISVRPTVRVRVSKPKGKDLIGALLVDTAKGTEPKTPEAESKRTNAMTHAAALLHRQVAEIVSEHADDTVKVSPEHCIIFHTFRQQRVCAPTSSRRMIRNVEAVCRSIASNWPGIIAPASFDQKRARYRD
jgi:hypothetical protein